MANAVSSATHAAVVAQTQATQDARATKQPTKNSGAPKDTVTISHAGRAAQQTASDTNHDGDSK